jgi:uncharacterized membrane protein
MRASSTARPATSEPAGWFFPAIKNRITGISFYSLVVAMTAQVSDVQITSKVIRRLTTAHGVIAFFFNVAVLALAVNIASSVMQ